jgi:hypothetical protein
MQRPTGVTILAVLSGIGGVLSLCGSLGLIGLGGLLGGVLGGFVASATDVPNSAVAGAVLGGLLGVGLGLVLLVSAFLSLAFAYGAWNLRPWAWMLGIISQVLSLAFALVSILSGSRINNHIVGIAISALILYYLNTPEVKRAFGRT